MSVQRRPSQYLPDPTKAPVLKYDCPPLYDWRTDRLRRRNSRDQRHKDTRNAAVRNHERVFVQAAEPRTQALCQHSVAFSALGHKRPSVLAARTQSFGIFDFDLRPGQPFPDAEAELLQDRVEAITLGRQTHRVARDFHCLPRALEGRREKLPGLIKLVDLMPEKDAQRSADCARLVPPARVEWDVALSLQAVFGVVGRFAMAHEDNAMRKIQHAETIPLDQLNPAFERAQRSSVSGRNPHRFASARHSLTVPTPAVVDTARMHAAAQACPSSRHLVIGHCSCIP